MPAFLADGSRTLDHPGTSPCCNPSLFQIVLVEWLSLPVEEYSLVYRLSARISSNHLRGSTLLQILLQEPYRVAVPVPNGKVRVLVLFPVLEPERDPFPPVLQLGLKEPPAMVDYGEPFRVHYTLEDQGENSLLPELAIINYPSDLIHRKVRLYRRGISLELRDVRIGQLDLVILQQSMKHVVELQLVILGPLNLLVAKIQQEALQLRPVMVRSHTTLLPQHKVDLTHTVVRGPTGLFHQPLENTNQRTRGRVAGITIQMPNIPSRNGSRRRERIKPYYKNN